MGFERIIKLYPAYDKKEVGAGIHGVNLLFVLKGDEGAVQFLLFTNWHLPHVTEYLKERHPQHDWFWEPMPADLGYHSPKPMFEGHEAITDSCEWLDGKPCYYDGSSLAAEDVYRVLLKEGSEGVWRVLEKYYREVFQPPVSDKPGKLKGAES